MSTSKYIGPIACILMVVCIVVSLIFANGKALGIQEEKRLTYEDKIFILHMFMTSRLLWMIGMNF